MHESLSDLFEVKKNAGDWVTLYRGEYFDLDPEKNSPKLVESPAAGPLESLGFNTGEVARLLLRYDLAMVQEWTDITLAARERNGDSFFKKNAKAYLRDNLKAASKGQRTAPDWWASMRREEEKSSVTNKELLSDLGLLMPATTQQENILGEGRERYTELFTTAFDELLRSGLSEGEARTHAELSARNRIKAEQGNQRRRNKSFNHPRFK